MIQKNTRVTRHTYGDDGAFGRRNIVSTTFTATDLGKASAANTTAILASTAGAVITTPTAQPSVPRNLTVTTTGAGTITIIGTNSEGATITENFVAAAAQTVVGTKAFASVTSINIPAAISASVGTGAAFGVSQRVASTSVAKLLIIPATGTPTLENAASSTFSASTLESNLVTPTTTLDGTAQVRLYILNYVWHVDPTNGNPAYGV